MLSPEIAAAVKDWLRLDKDESTRADVGQLLDRKNDAELTKRFQSRIKFGTAGLRGRMQAGPSSMNALVILQTAQGLARYAEDAQQLKSNDKRIVIGYDARYNSRRFAALTASVFRRHGWTVCCYKEPVHTPLVPFGVTHLKAAVGVCVTASHNPAQDNGFKVYWSNGVQIIAPHDEGIAKRIENSLEVPSEAWELDDSLIGFPEDTEVQQAYFDKVAGLCTRKSDNAKSPLRFAYTAMHGVGLPAATQAFKSFGFPESSFCVVKEQAQPDPDFPTVAFPNPEEHGALDLAIKTADAEGAAFVLANDPDADRFSAAERVNGAWKILTGDQLGALLGVWIFEQYAALGKDISKLAMCASTVSSKMLSAVAKSEGFTFRETLTGFKYLGNEGATLEQEGFDSAFLYEEAIGFAVGSFLRDKDGVSALGVACEMLEALRQRGLSANDQLERLFAKYGYFETANSYLICGEPAKTNRIFSRLRYGSEDAAGGELSIPKTLAGFEIKSIRDLTVGFDSTRPPSFQPVLPVDPSAHMITFTLGDRDQGDGVEVVGTIRTSGTEPKIKYYIEASGRAGLDRKDVQSKLLKVRDAVETEWLLRDEFGLSGPSS